MATEQFANDAVTTLAAACASGDTTITVVSAAGFPPAAQFRVRVDNEILLVTALAGTTWTVTRAAEPVAGTQAAAAHANGTPVFHLLTAASVVLATGGGTGLTAAAVDALFAGTGSTYIALQNQANSFGVGPQTITSDATGHKGLVVQGYSTSQTAYVLEVLNAPTGAVHFGSGSADSGGYLVSTSASQGIVTGGVVWNGSQWIPKATSCATVQMSGGTTIITGDTGLTVGLGVGLTTIMQVNADQVNSGILGQWGVGTLSPAAPLHIIANETAGAPYGQIRVQPASSNSDSAVALRSTRNSTTQDWFFGTGSGASPNTNNFRIVDITGGNLDFLNIVPGTGSVILGPGSVATNATGGFLYLANCAGQPTGTPTSFSGYVPVVIDTTNGKLWAYYGGAWHFTTLT